MKKLLLMLMPILLLASGAQAFSGDPVRGASIYKQRCAICHGVDGRGENGMAVDFHGERHRLAKSDNELMANIRQGLMTQGARYRAGAMPPQILTDEQLRDVLGYIRQTFSR